jgi:hypothetical protein
MEGYKLCAADVGQYTTLALLDTMHAKTNLDDLSLA